MTARPDEVVAWPESRVNIADPHENDARIVGFRIRPGDRWYGKNGLSEPMFAFTDAIEESQKRDAALQSANARLAELEGERDALRSEVDIQKWLLEQSLQTIKFNGSFLEALSNDMAAAGVRLDTSAEPIRVVNDYIVKHDALDKRLADVLALANEFEVEGLRLDSVAENAYEIQASATLDRLATLIRRAAAGEGDANQGDTK